MARTPKKSGPPRKRAAIPTSSTATEQVNLQLAIAVEELATAEGQLLGLSRNQFLRNLIGRLMGRVHMERPPNAPTVEPLGDEDHSTKQIAVRIDEEMLAFLSDLERRSGNVSKSALVTLMVLQWAQVLPELFAPPAEQ